MKNILFLLLFSVSIYGQNPTPFSKIKITGNGNSTTATKVNVQESNGVVNTISKSDLQDILKFTNISAFPSTGEIGKFYYTIDTNKYYSWNSTTYVEIGGVGGGGSDPTKLAIINNLADLNNITTARANLGLGALALSSATIPTTTSQLTNNSGFITSYTETDPIVKTINGIVKSNGTTISAAGQTDITGLLGAGSISNTMLANGAVASLSGTNSGDNATNTTSNAYADGKVQNSLVASTVLAPSVTAVNTGLGTKEPTITAGTTAQYWRGDKTFQTLDKTAVGLANVDNTSDANKPVSTATQTALNLKANIASPTFTGTVTLPTGQIVNGVTLSTLAGTGVFLKGDGTYGAPAGGGDMVLATAQTNTGVKTFLDGTMGLRNVGNTFTSTFTNTNTAARTYTLKDASGTLAFTSDIPTNTNQLTNGSGFITSAPPTNITYTPSPTIGAIASSTGTGATIALADATNSGLFSASEKTKLAGIATGATANVGTVTNVSALTLGTTGTDLSSTVATGGTTPVITLQVPTASATNRGALSSGDWSTFNGKLATNGSGASLTGITPAQVGAQPLATNLTSIGALANGTGVLTNNGTGTFSYVPATTGTVTAIGITTANGISGTSSGGVTPNLTIALGAITPTSVASTGAVTGSNLSGINTGDNAVNSLYSGLVSNATHTGDVTGTTALTITAAAVTNAKLANMAANTIKGVSTAGVPTDLTAAQAKAVLAIANTDVSGLGTASTQNSTAFEVPLTFSTGLTRTTNTVTVNATQNINTLSNLTTAGFVKSTATGVLSSTALASGDVTTALGFTPYNVTNPSAYISTVNGTTITPSSTNGVSATTMAYNDATSSIQTQLNGKQNSIPLATNPYKQEVSYSNAGVGWVRIASDSSGSGDYFGEFNITNLFTNNISSPISFKIFGSYLNGGDIIQIGGSTTIISQVRIVYPSVSSNQYFIECYFNNALTNPFSVVLSSFHNLNLLSTPIAGSIPANYLANTRVFTNKAITADLGVFNGLATPSGTGTKLFVDNATTATIGSGLTLSGGILTANGSGISLTTTGTSGASTLVGSVLNIPNYASGGSSAWGGITGTLSAQTDLQNALNLKQPTSSGLTTLLSTPYAGQNTIPVMGVSGWTSTAEANLLHSSGNETRTGTLNMTNTTAIPNSLSLTNFDTAGGGYASQEIILDATSVNARGLKLTNASNTSTAQLIYNNANGVGLNIQNTGTGVATIYNNVSGASTGDLIQFQNNNVLTAKVNALGEITTPKLTINEKGTLYDAQGYIGLSQMAFWKPQGNSTVVPGVLGFTAPTVVGTVTARNVATTNRATRERRIGYVSVATAGGLAEQRVPVTQYSCGSGVANDGSGFKYTTTFVPSNAATVTGERFFIGLTNTTTAATNVEPNILLNSIGIAQLSTDATQFYLVYGGSTAQTAIPCGTGLGAPNTLSTSLYELTINAPTTIANTYYVKFRNIQTNAIFTQTITGSAVQVPTSSMLLAHKAWKTNNATALAVGFDIGGIYFENN